MSRVARIEAAESASLWVRAILAAIPSGLGEGQVQILSDFLRAFAPSAPSATRAASAEHPKEERPFGLTVSSQVDLSDLVFAIQGETWAIIPRFAAWLSEVGLPDDALEGVRRAGEALKPETFSAWVELAETGNDLGWSFAGPIPLDLARRHVLKTDVETKLARWAQHYDVTEVTSLGASMGGALPFSQLHIPLPGGDLLTELEVGLAAFSDLGVAPPPGEALEALRSYGAPGLSLTAWFCDGGLVKVSLFTDSASTDLLLRVADAAGVFELAPLAALQGSLGGVGAHQLEMGTTARGFVAYVHHQLGARLTTPLSTLSA